MSFWNLNSEEKVGRPEEGERADEAPLRGSPGPAPDPSLGSTLPQSSVPLADLQEAADEGLGTKGL